MGRCLASSGYELEASTPTTLSPAPSAKTISVTAPPKAMIRKELLVTGFPKLVAVAERVPTVLHKTTARILRNTQFILMTSFPVTGQTVLTAMIQGL